MSQLSTESRWWPAGTAAAVFAVFGVLAVLPWPALRHADAAAPTAGHRLLVHDTGLRVAALTVTDLGSPPAVDVVTVVLAIALVLTHRWPTAAVLAVARLGELVTAAAVKVAVHRPRPGLLPHLTTATGDSFPSGHTAGSAAVYGTIALVVTGSLGPRPRGWTIAGVVGFVAAVAASRVLLGVHYPTDVLGGAALGIAWAALAVRLTPGDHRGHQHHRGRDQHGPQP
jgi:undecaprenyl-diphosphatase